MMNSYFKLSLVSVITTMLLSSCGLFQNQDKFQNDLNSNVETFNQDYNDYKTELENLDNNLDEALKDVEGFGKTEQGFGVASSPLCGATMDTSQLSQGILIFNFDGITPCFSPSSTRSGSVQVELIEGNLWSDVGAVMKQTFIDYEVTILQSGRSLTVNGVKTLKNVNGHNWAGWPFISVEHTYESRAFDVQVEFDNGQTATWNHARRSTVTWNPQNADPVVSNAHFAYSVIGDTTLNGITTVDSWGTNRFGDDFVTRYEEAITSNTYCGLWRFTTGRLIHEVDGDNFTLDLGVDQNGNPSTTVCAYGFKVSWNVGNNSNSQVFSY